MLRFLIPILLLSGAGCTASYNTQHLAADQDLQLVPESAMYIAVPKYGSFEGEVYDRSGQTVGQAVSIASSRHANSLTLADSHMPRDKAPRLADDHGPSYLVWPVIAHWEQRAIAWSRLPSRMVLQISIIDVADGGELTSSIIEGYSRVIAMTDTQPESLLEDPLRTYVRALY